MVKFYDLVEKMLVMHEASNALTPREFLSNEPLNKFNQIYSNFYASTLNKTEFELLIGLIDKSANQTNYVQGDFERYIEFFPYIDFLTYVIQEAIKEQKPLLTKFNTSDNDLLQRASAAVDSYIVHFKSKAIKNGWPLDYAPITPRATILQSDLRKRQYNSVVGQLALSNYASKSLQEAIFGLLKARKIARDPNNKAPNDSNYIQQLLLTPEKFAGGNVQIPQDLRRLYDSVTAETLIQIGVAIKQFFESEKTLRQQQISAKKSSSAIETSIQQFFVNEPKDSDAFVWQIDNKAQTKPLMGILRAPSGLSGGYTIENIKKMSSKSEHAANLYKQLENFANYTKTKEATDWAGVARGVQKVASSLSGWIGGQR
jgi:hypothetical protein